MKGPNKDWEAFYTWLLAQYWPSVPPALRFESRPETPAGEPPVPDDIWRAALLVFPDPEAWLHNPIPRLRGKTPLDLIARGGADVVRETIQSVAPVFLPDPSDLRLYPDEEDE